jgi:hypothetical protein
MKLFLQGEEFLFDNATAESTTKPIEISIDTDKVAGFALIEFGEREIVFKIEDVKNFFKAVKEEYQK